MSRHRFIHNLDLDDEQDDFDGDQEDDYDPNDDPAMRTALAEARAFLGDDYTDKEIQESLWYYYYDVEKTVNYLISRKEKANQPKPTKNGASKTKGMAHFFQAMIQEDLGSANVHSHERPPSAKNFFADCPWLNVPVRRQSTFMIEHSYPRGGLLGGSSKEAPKKSKLASLAAARKQKAQESSVKQENTSVSLLDSLVKNNENETPNSTPKRKYPFRRQEENPQPKAETVFTEEPPPEATQPEPQNPDPVVSISQPSTFAATMLGTHSKVSKTFDPPSLLNPFQLTGAKIDTNINPFSGPSPDDIVSKAQSSSKGMKPKTQPKTNDTKKDTTNGISEDLSKSTLSEPKPESRNLDVLTEYRNSTPKPSSNFVVIGHVDAGKSTLMGRLLLDLGVVDQRTLEKYKRESSKIGKSSFALAWVLDQSSEERAHGVTIDIAMNKFETEKTNFTILDAPGHKDFVPNMIAGAAQADFAILVIDSSTGSYESGLKGQTKEHALLVRSMGVQRLIVAVNKLDATSWSEPRYEEITQQMTAFLTSVAGFPAGKIDFVPCSGLNGGNIVSRAEECKWYTGPTLLSLLESAEPTSQQRMLEGPLRLPISQVFSTSVQFPLSVQGRITSGSVQIGDAISIIPSEQSGFVRGISVDDEPSDWAVAGQNTTLHLSSEVDAKMVKGGDILCSSTSPIPLMSKMVVKILAFEHVMPMFCSVLAGRLNTSARITELQGILDKATGLIKTASAEGKKKKKVRVIKPGEAARIAIEVEGETGIPLETGARIVLRAEGETIATGIVEDVK